MSDSEPTTEKTTDAPAPDSPKLAWRTLVGAAIGGGAIVIAALLGIGAIKSDGGSDVRAGRPGGQFPFPGPQGRGPQGPGGRMPGQMPPPPFMQRPRTGRTGT